MPLALCLANQLVDFAQQTAEGGNQRVDPPSGSSGRWTTGAQRTGWRGPAGCRSGRQREGKQQLAVQVGTDDTFGGDYRLSGGTDCYKATVNAFAITFEGRTPIS